MDDDRPPICPRCGVTMVPVALSADGDPGGDWAVVTFVPPTASGVRGTSDIVTCDHLSGIAYPIGTTTVTCSAPVMSGSVTDITGTTQFTITVTPQTSSGGGGGGGGTGGGGGGGQTGGNGGATTDTTAPTIKQHPDIVVEAINPSGAVVSYTVSASDPDNSTAQIVTTCSPPGSIFSLGPHAATKTTTVTCTSHDPAGNESAPMSFRVTVLGVHAQVTQLEQSIKTTSALSQKKRTAFLTELVLADRYFGAGEKLRARLELQSLRRQLVNLPLSLSHRPTVWIVDVTHVLAVVG